MSGWQEGKETCISYKPPPPVISMGGYQRIRRYGRTNGRTFDLPSESVGGRIIEVSGQRGGKFSSRARHFFNNLQNLLDLLTATRQRLALILSKKMGLQQKR